MNDVQTRFVNGPLADERWATMDECLAVLPSSFSRDLMQKLIDAGMIRQRGRSLSVTDLAKVLVAAGVMRGGK